MTQIQTRIRNFDPSMQMWSKTQTSVPMAGLAYVFLSSI